MALPGADTQTQDEILKDYFEDFIAEQVNNKNPLKDEFRMVTDGFTGRQVIKAAHVGRNMSGGMFTAEDGLFPGAGSQEHVQLTIDQRKYMHRIRLTWEVMNDTGDKKGAFIQAKRSEMTGAINDIARREEYALATDGRGVLARIDDSDPDGNTTLELDAPGGFTGNDFGNRFVWPGMAIAAVNPATGGLRSGVATVTAVNSDGTDVTAAVTTFTEWADSDYIVQAANTSVTSINDTTYEKAWWGLPALIDDGTYRNDYFGVDRSVYDQYQSYVVGSVGALSLDLLQRVSDVVDQKLGGRIDLILSHHSIRRIYIQLLEADRRYSGASLMKPDGATAAFKQGDLTIGEVPYKVIRDFPLATLMLLDKSNSDFKCYASEQGKWVDEDGSIMQRVGVGSTARDAFEAWYRIRKQYFAEYPGYNARLDGITGQTLVVVRAA